MIAEKHIWWKDAKWGKIRGQLWKQKLRNIRMCPDSNLGTTNEKERQSILIIYTKCHHSNIHKPKSFIFGIIQLLQITPMLTSCSVCSCWREKLRPPLKKREKKLPCLDDQSWPHTKMFPNWKRGLCVILSLPGPFYGTSEVGCFDVSHLMGHLQSCFETITHLASPFLVWVSADVFRFGLGTWRMQEGKHSRSHLGPWQAWAYYTELHPGGEKWDVLVHSRMSPEDWGRGGPRLYKPPLSHWLLDPL